MKMATQFLNLMWGESMNFDKGNSRAIIICAACRCEGIVIAGARHWDKGMTTLHKSLGIEVSGTAHWEQGFIDQFNNFYSRKEAFNTIERNDKQTVNTIFNGSETILFSEGLY